MNMLATLNVATDAVEEKDTLGGGSFLAESGAYKSRIELAYMSTAKSGAIAVNFHVKLEDGKLVRRTEYITSGTAKGLKTYYEKDGKKHNLPGFSLVNDMCLLATGKMINQLETEEKVVKLYDYEAKGEVPKPVQVIVDLIGQEIIAGVIKQTVDKNTKQADGTYAPSGETRDENIIEKFFYAEDGRTVAECKAKAEKAEFIDKWKEKNEGVTRNKAKGKAENGTTAGAPSQATTSLFANQG